MVVYLLISIPLLVVLSDGGKAATLSTLTSHAHGGALIYMSLRYRISYKASLRISAQLAIRGKGVARDHIYMRPGIQNFTTEA